MTKTNRMIAEKLILPAICLGDKLVKDKPAIILVSGTFGIDKDKIPYIT